MFNFILHANLKICLYLAHGEFILCYMVLWLFFFLACRAGIGVLSQEDMCKSSKL
jgi:hypothetical protein